MADETDELHVEQVDHFLRLLLVSQIGQNQLSVVRGEAFVEHERVVDEHRLLQRLLDLPDLLVLELGQLEPVDFVLCHVYEFVCVEDGALSPVVCHRKRRHDSIESETAILAAVHVADVALHGFLVDMDRCLDVRWHARLRVQTHIVVRDVVQVDVELVLLLDAVQWVVLLLLRARLHVNLAVALLTRFFLGLAALVLTALVVDKDELRVGHNVDDLVLQVRPRLAERRLVITLILAFFSRIVVHITWRFFIVLFLLFFQRCQLILFLLLL